MRLVHVVPAAALLAITAFPASADGLEPGYWKVTSTPQISGAAV